MASGHRFAVVVLLLYLAATAIGQQQPPPTFSTSNRTVAVYATVTDAAGRLVPDLDRSAFSIDDNGRPTASLEDRGASAHVRTDAELSTL